MEPTPRSTVRRLAERAPYDAGVGRRRSSTPASSPTSAILVPGRAVVIPMAYARVDDTVYVHGSTASRMMRALKTGDAMCITVTVVDGIVLARSAFNMSMNYRAVVDPRSRPARRRPGRAHDRVPGDHGPRRSRPLGRGPAAERRRAAPDARHRGHARRGVGEGAARGPSEDEPEDVDLPVWAGVIPLRTVAGPADRRRGRPRRRRSRRASVTAYARGFWTAEPSVG